MNLRIAVHRPFGRPRARAASSRARVPYLRWVRLRLTLWYVGILFVLFALIGASVYISFRRVLAGETDSDLRAVAAATDRRVADLLQPSESLAGSLHAPGPSNDPAGLGSEFLNAYPDVFALFQGANGTLESNPTNVPIGLFPDAASITAAQRGHPDLRTVHKRGQAYRILSQQVVYRGFVAGTVQVGKPLRVLDRQTRDLALLLLAGGSVALVLAGAGGLLVAGRALRPARVGWQRQQAFVADASHELRTPLAVLRADAEVLLRRPEKTVEQGRELVQDIIQEADQLNALIGDLLTLARLDAGQLPVQRTLFDARELLDEIAEQTRRLLDGRGIAVGVHAPAALPLEADRDRIVQVLRILIDNAQRYTPAGGTITLSARALVGRVLLAVADTGCGIEPEHLPRVFERFYRAEPSRSRSEGGTGLGLAIARSIVEAHGGELSLSSKPGDGATATLELPARDV